MKRLKLILFVSLCFTLILIFILNRYNSYLNFKEKLTAQIELINFVLEDESVDISYFDKTNKNSTLFVKMIETQLFVNKYTISDIGVDRIDVFYNKDTKEGYVAYCKGCELNILDHLPFNTNNEFNNAFVLKKYFFMEYLLSKNFCIIVATFKTR